MGLTLSAFTLGVGIPTQFNAFLGFWDIGSTPGIFDDKDVLYLQFGSALPGPLRNVRENDIRLTGWGIYAAGSKVKPGDSDMGQPIRPNPFPSYTSAGGTGFQYMNVVGGPGYDMGDPVYLKTVAPPAAPGTNDIRITGASGFPAGSRVSLSDPECREAGGNL